MEAELRPLGATVLYRAVLDSILKRARSITYPHGIRYLKKLERLAKSVSEWGAVDNHEIYFEQLRKKHYRKSSFWSRCSDLG